MVFHTLRLEPRAKHLECLVISKWVPRLPAFVDAPAEADCSVSITENTELVVKDTNVVAHHGKANIQDIRAHEIGERVDWWPGERMLQHSLELTSSGLVHHSADIETTLDGLLVVVRELGRTQKPDPSAAESEADHCAADEAIDARPKIANSAVIAETSVQRRFEERGHQIVAAAGIAILPGIAAEAGRWRGRRVLEAHRSLALWARSFSGMRGSARNLVVRSPSW